MANYYYMISGVDINGVDIPFDDISFDPTVEKQLKQSGARAGFSFTGAATVEPVCNITSPALATVLDISGLNAAVVTSFNVYLDKYGPTGVEAGNVHRKATMTGGVVRMNTISGDKSGVKISLEVHGNYDGSNASWVVVDNVAAYTGVVVDEVCFTWARCLSGPRSITWRAAPTMVGVRL
jgi:hypothetical protein